MRPFCVNVTLVGCDEEKGPQVFRIDPSGQSIGFKAISTGSKEQEAMSQLEKKFKQSGADLDSKQTVEAAISVLQSVVSSDFKANEVEIGFCTVQEPRFRKLNETEIDNILTYIADK